MTIFSRALVLALLLCFAVVSSVAAGEDEAKYKNDKPVFKALSPEEETRLAPIKRGKPPAMDKAMLKKLKKGEVVIKEIPKKATDKGGEKAKRFEAIGIVNASPKAVMAFMRDFAAFVGPMPHLEKIDFKWDRNLAVVRQDLEIMLFSIWYRLNILHYKNAMIEWEFLEGDIKDTSGYYKFFPFKKGKKTLVVYHVYTEPGIAVPQTIMDFLTKRSMPDVIETIRKEVKKRSGSGGSR